MFGHDADVRWSRADLTALGDLVRALAVSSAATIEPPAELVRLHGLAPLAYTHGLSTFRNDHIVSGLRCEQQRAFANEAVAALVGAGVPVALLKGISYAGSLYTDPAERPMQDVDLLVPRADHAGAVHALSSLGYRLSGSAVQRSAWHHSFTLKRPTGGTIDLHRSPTQVGRVRIDFEGVWRRSQPSPWIPGALRLDATDELLLHLINLARSDLVAPGRTFVDAARLLQRVDPHEVEDRARDWAFLRVFGLVQGVVEHVVGNGPLPRWWLPDKYEVFQGNPPPRTVQIGRKALLVEGPREFWALCRAVADGVIHARRAQHP